MSGRIVVVVDEEVPMIEVTKPEELATKVELDAVDDLSVTTGAALDDEIGGCGLPLEVNNEENRGSEDGRGGVDGEIGLGGAGGDCMVATVVVVGSVTVMVCGSGMGEAS